MRRHRRDASPVTARLLDPDAWPSLAGWAAARREHDRAHGWPGGTLARLREQVAVRLDRSGWRDVQARYGMGEAEPDDEPGGLWAVPEVGHDPADEPERVAETTRLGW